MSDVAGWWRGGMETAMSFWLLTREGKARQVCTVMYCGGESGKPTPHPSIVHDRATCPMSHITSWWSLKETRRHLKLVLRHSPHVCEIILSGDDHSELEVWYCHILWRGEGQWRWQLWFAMESLNLPSSPFHSMWQDCLCAYHLVVWRHGNKRQYYYDNWSFPKYNLKLCVHCIIILTVFTFLCVYLVKHLAT